MAFATDQNLDDSGLSSFSRSLLALREDVLAHWERQTRVNIDLARGLPHPILLDTLPAFYDNLAEALTPQYPRACAGGNANIAEVHGDERARMTGYGPEQVIHEYQLFRDAFIHVLAANAVEFDPVQWAVFQASIDRAMREAVRHLTQVHQSLRHRTAAALSHDMRGPLSAIISGANVLALRADADQANRLTAARIVENGQRLNGMVEELLEALSFDPQHAVPLVIERTDLWRIADAVCRAINAGGAGRCALTGEQVIGYWCPNALRRALENLTGNAIKYGDGGLINIHLGHAHGRVMLSVHNDGATIPSASRDRIFEYLRRDDSDKASGWGIGLPFVRSVAQSHGGSVVVDSAPETGTTFTIDMPLDSRPYAGKIPVF